jgi:hypothetical protein
MSAPSPDLLANPYSSPQFAAPEAPPAVEPAPHGSVGLILTGFFLLLVGYLTSNLFAIADLYGLGMGPAGEQVPSPLSAVFTTPFQRWMFYVATGAAFVSGAVLLGSQRFNPITVVCYVMCPLAGLAFLVASPLREIKRFAEPVAALYLLVGSALAFTGVSQLYVLYGNTSGSFVPVLASMMTQVGLAMVIGAMLKFWHAK